MIFHKSKEIKTLTDDERKLKLRWFKFFFSYKEAFEELSGRKCKKLILAMFDYVQYGVEPKKMDSKTQSSFDSFKSFYQFDKELAKINGSKGGKKAHKTTYRHTKGGVNKR